MAPDGVATVESGWVEAGRLGAGWACGDSVDAGGGGAGCVAVGSVDTGWEDGGRTAGGFEDGGRTAGGRWVVGVGIGGVDAVSIGTTVGSGGIVSDSIVLDVVVSSFPAGGAVARVMLMFESLSVATAVSWLFDEAKPITMTSDPTDRTDVTDHPSAGVTARRLSVSGPWSRVTTPASPTEKRRWVTVVVAVDAGATTLPAGFAAGVVDADGTLGDDPTSWVELSALSDSAPEPASACALTSAATRPAAKTPATERAVACRVLMRSR